MDTERNQPRELEEILSEAVDRQLAEQRALRDVLDELRGAVRDLSSRPAPAPADISRIEERVLELVRNLPTPQVPIDFPGLEDRIRNAIEINIRGADENIRAAVQSSILGASETTFASLSEQLRGLREALVPRLETVAGTVEAVRGVGEEITAVRKTVGSVYSDVEGIAQALIDFNSGLRQWASGLEESMTSIRETVDRLGQVTSRPIARPKPPTGDADTEIELEGEEEEEELPEVPREISDTEKKIDERIKETADLSVYLADQLEDLDGLMARLSELPQNLDGVVSQALRRTLTARAKLDREAETALDDVLEALDDHVNQLTGILERFQHEENLVRKMALEQVELSSRVESLHQTVLERLEAIGDERRHGEEALAVAIDRSARGLAPRALESLAKPVKRRQRAGKAKPSARKRAAPKASEGKRKAAKASSSRKSAARRSAGKQPTGKAKGAQRRKPPDRQDWTPLPDASGETLA